MENSLFPSTKHWQMLDARITNKFLEQNDFDLESNLFMACYVGSLSHGTHIENSIDDIDIFCVVIPPANRKLGLQDFNHWSLQENELDVVIYSLEKYIRMLVKANPNVLGTLNLNKNHYIYQSQYFNELIKNREWFYSMETYNSFVGYAFNKLNFLERKHYKGYMGKLRKELVDKYGYDCRDASHLIRLFRMGIEFIETEKLNVYRENDWQELIDIKQGKWTLEQIKEEAAKLEERMKLAKENTKLSLKPNISKIEKWLVDTYLEYYANDNF